MDIHYNIWKKVRHCTILCSLLISNAYISELEDFIKEEERWEEAWQNID